MIRYYRQVPCLSNHHYAGQEALWTSSLSHYLEIRNKYSKGNDKYSKGTDKYSKGIDKISMCTDKKSMHTDKVSMHTEKKSMGTAELPSSLEIPNADFELTCKKCNMMRLVDSVNGKVKIEKSGLKYVLVKNSRCCYFCPGCRGKVTAKSIKKL